MKLTLMQSYENYTIFYHSGSYHDLSIVEHLFCDISHWIVNLTKSRFIVGAHLLILAI